MRAIAFDMGGTSTDVCLIDGEPAQTSLSEIDGLPIRLPRVDVHTIGCGGGSIAWLDSAGALQVGPESAGAEPGPAIYGRGDSLTATDANALLGRLPLERFNLSVDVAHAARVARQFATEIGRDAEEVCEAIVMRAEANMAAAIRKISSEKGRDPGDFALIAYGGSGPLHACAIAL